jgi:hypothetical protein
MVEVFKTNVKEYDEALIVLAQIHLGYSSYKANFDLQDCDKVLRVECTDRSVEPSVIIGLLNDFGFSAEVLPDTSPAETLREEIVGTNLLCDL